VDVNLRVIEWVPNKSGRGWFFMNSLAKTLGLPEYSGDLMHGLGADRIFLDGLLSVWHP
jgi:protease-4